MTTVTKTIWIGFTASILLLLIRQCDAFVTSAWGGGSVRARPAPCLPVPPARTVVGVNRRILQLRPVVKSSLANIIISSSALYQKSDGLAEKLTLDGVEIRGPIAAVQNVLIVKLKDTLLATGGGILLPDQSKEKPTEGLVVASGPGRIHPHTGIRLDNPIRPGMSVLFGKFDGTPIEYKGDDCQVVRDDNVLLAYEGITMRLENILCVRDYVLIELEQSQGNVATSSGVVIAAQVLADSVPCTGRVVRIGPGRATATGGFAPSPVQPGDFVKFKDYAGNDVLIEGKPYSVVRMVDILCTLNEKTLDE